MNETTQSFKDLVKTCLMEVKQENDKKKQLRSALKTYVRKVLKEAITGPTLQEPDEEDAEKVSKQYNKAGNQPAEITQDKQVEELTKIVHSINKDFTVKRDVQTGPTTYTSGKRNFIIVDAGNLFSIMINEKWENSFDLTAYVKESDRVIAIGLNWEQVKAFVKANFSEVSKTYVGQAADKVTKNREDKTDKKDKSLPDTTVDFKKDMDEPEKEVGDEEAEDMTTKKEDEPSEPLKAVTKPGESPKTNNTADDQKKTDKVKPPTHKNDTKLVQKMPGKKK